MTKMFHESRCLCIEFSKGGSTTLTSQDITGRLPQVAGAKASEIQRKELLRHSVVRHLAMTSYMYNVQTSEIKVLFKIRRHLRMASRKSIGTSNSNATL